MTLRLKLLWIFLLTSLSCFSQYKEITLGASIDHYILFPYNNISVVTRNNLSLEWGMLDYPSSTNMFFQSTVKTRAQNYAWLVTSIEDYGDYRKKTRGNVHYFFMGYRFSKGDLRADLQLGMSTDEGVAIKMGTYYRAIESRDLDWAGIMDLGCFYVVTEARRVAFLGYRAGVSLD